MVVILAFLIGVVLEIRKRGLLRGWWLGLLLVVWVVPWLPQLHIFVPWIGAAGVLCFVLLSKLGRIVGSLLRRRLESRAKRLTIGLPLVLGAGAVAGVLAFLAGLLPSGSGLAGPALAGAVVCLGGHLGARFAASMRRRFGGDSRGWPILGARFSVLRLREDLLISAPLALFCWAPFLATPFGHTSR